MASHPFPTLFSGCPMLLALFEKNLPTLRNTPTVNRSLLLLSLWRILATPLSPIELKHLSLNHHTSSKHKPRSQDPVPDNWWALPLVKHLIWVLVIKLAALIIIAQLFFSNPQTADPDRLLSFKGANAPLDLMLPSHFSISLDPRITDHRSNLIWCLKT